MRQSALFFAALSSLGSAHAASIDCAQCEAWNKEQAPFQIFGNTYFVGTHGLSAVLITSSQGHVLIDGALPQSAPLIAEHIARLGFKVTDIEVILNSHVHSDHAGGIAELQKLSGAKIVASEAAVKTLRTGKADPSDPQFNILQPYPAASQVESLGDKQTVTVGPLKLSVIHTPGHTVGGTSWTWQSCEGQRCLDIVYGDSLNAVSDKSFKYSSDVRYPNAQTDMARSIAAVAATRCDILIAAHPDSTKLWTVIDEKGAGDRTKLIDATACSRYAAAAKGRLEQRLKNEQ